MFVLRSAPVAAGGGGLSRTFSTSPAAAAAAAKKGLIRRMMDLSKPVVTVLPLKGVITTGQWGGGSAKQLNLDSTSKLIDKAFAPSKLKAVLLNVNSPGGYPAQCEMMGDYIKRKAKERQVPLISFVDDQANSGGYWLACLGERIYANPSSTIGSVGVISGGFGLQDVIKHWGVERRVIKSGQNKDLMDPFQPLREEHEAVLRKILDGIHENFKDMVRESRGKRLKPASGKDEELFQGDVWLARDAIDLGLIDGFDTVDSFVEREYGDSVRLVKLKKQGSFWEKIGGTGGGAQARTILADELEAFAKCRIQ